MINKWQFCAAKQAKSTNYAASPFCGEYMKIMLLVRNYAKTGLLPKIMLAQSIKAYQQPRATTVAVVIFSLCLFC